ncbi:MAG TPA: hypothetical protein VG097_11140 [Gemmata sp.]|jgi:hypothetical protein|nr:hypothetical protein [Gemmata sp.]
MRIVILFAGLFVVVLAGIGIYYSPHLWKDDQYRFIYDEKTRAEKEAYAREHLKYESLVERLPKGDPISPTHALDDESKKFWEILDGNLARDQDERAELLKAYHDKTRQFFVGSPGAGSERTIRINPDDVLLDHLFEFGNPVQPGQPARFPDSPNETLNRVKPNEEFYFYHDGGLSDFLYPRGFGYVKDREHVAGFKPHGFRHLGVAEHERWHWRVQHVQLIGILQREQPVVYLTDKLPSMEQVRQGQTRALDYFEVSALPALCDGEDLYIVNKDNTIRMLGAIRGTKVCLQCHDAKVGDLLGAFSYTLRPAPKAN